MSSVLKTLLICLGLTAAVLAFAVPQGRDATPEVVVTFFELAFRGEVATPGDAVTPLLITDVGGSRISQVCRSYRGVLGLYNGVVREVDRTYVGGSSLELELELAFERANAIARVRLERPTGRWLVDRFWLDVPEEFELEPDWAVVEPVTHALVSRMFGSEHFQLWNVMTDAEQKRVGGRAYFLSQTEVTERVGAAQQVELGEVERLDEHRARIRVEAKMERGHVKTELIWVWHEVFWSVEHLEYEVTQD